MKVIKVGWTLVKEASLAWLGNNAPRLGAALAFYTAFSLAPLLIVAVAVVSLVFPDQQQVQAAVVAQVGGLIGRDGEQVIGLLFDNAFEAYRLRAGLVASLVGAGLLLFGSSIVLGELKAALNIIWGVTAEQQSGLLNALRFRLVALSMVFGIGFLLLVSLVVSAGLTAFAGYVGEGLVLPAIFLNVADMVLSILVITLLFALLYKLLPDTKVAWGDVWLGAALASVLFSSGKFLIGLYLGNSALGSAYGVAGSFVIFLLWIYYSAQIFFFGAEFAKVYARHYGSRRQTQQASAVSR